MHRQTEQRETRLLELVPDPRATEVVAVVAGEGNARLFRSLGATSVVEGGQSMNPSTAEILAADRRDAPRRRSSCCRTTRTSSSPPEQAAAHAAQAGAGRRRPARSRPGSRRWSPTTAPARRRTNAAEMEDAVAAVATGAVTIASRDGAARRPRRPRRARSSGSSRASRSPAAPAFEEVAARRRRAAARGAARGADAADGRGGARG